MAKFLTFIISIVLLTSCGSAKKAQVSLNAGDYENTINLSLEKLRNNKTKKGNQTYIYMLEEAFAKATSRDLENINFYKKDGNPANYEKIFETYLALDNRQKLIKPLLPLYISEAGRNAKFDFKNYDSDIISSKNILSDYLYDNVEKLVQNAKTKYDYRRAYDDLFYLNRINPGYKDVENQLYDIHMKGVDFVRVYIINESDKVIPKKLEDDMLNIDTYDINDLWTIYHNNPQDNIQYDYQMDIVFKKIEISPERVTERQVIKEKNIKDGWKYLYDNDGNPVKDSLGNNIKVDKFRNVTCELYEFTQNKSVQVSGHVYFKDLETKQLIETYPLSSSFIFEHVYATYNGDKRALDDDLIRLLNLHAVPFPSNEQMIFDAGEDLKNNIKSIITGHRFD